MVRETNTNSLAASSISHSAAAFQDPLGRVTSVPASLGPCCSCTRDSNPLLILDISYLPLKISDQSETLL